MKCPSCGDRDIGEIRFASVASGVSFRFCRYCEHRWWAGQGHDLGLDEVLNAATVLARAS